jgi:hypothetical protein
MTMGKSHLEHFVLTTQNKWFSSGAQNKNDPPHLQICVTVCNDIYDIADFEK